MAFIIGGGITIGTGISFIDGSAAPAANDPYFEYVTTLLPGNGTNNAANNTFVDNSTNNFSVAQSGNTTQGSLGPYGGGWSNYFATKTNSLSIPATTALTTFTGDFTFECWVYPTDATISTSWGIWDSRQTGATANPMIFTLSALASPVSGSWRLRYYNGTAHSGTGTVLVNQWSHVAFVRSGSTMTFYVNGVAGGTATISGTQTGNATTNPVVIGSKDNGLAGYGTVGYISNFRIVNGTAVYTANFTPPTQPLTAIANTSLLTCADNRFVDDSANNFVITRVGDVSVKKFNPFGIITSAGTETIYSPAVYGGSMYFDGTGDYLSLTPNISLTLNGDYTIEFWVYFASLDTAERIPVNSWNTGAGWLVSTQSSAWNFKSAGAFTLTYSAVAPTAGRWYHVAATRSGSATNNVKFFINGVQVAQGTNTSTLTPAASSTGFVAGGGQGGTGQLITGYVSDVRVVKDTALYTASFTPPTQPLTAVANTSLLLSGTDAAIYDASINNDFETLGNAKISTAVSKFGGSSMIFDGTGDYLVSFESLSSTFNTGNYTIESWIYRSDSGTQRAIVDTRGASTVGLLFYITSNNKLNVFDSTSTYITSTNTVPSSQWVHVAVTRNSGTTRLFINGNVEATLSNDTRNNVTGAAGLYVGRQFGSITNDFIGYMQDVRITKGFARYTANFTPPIEAFPLY